ncbi:MAG: aminotransferase class I/II-fold pyridoxal phosphate-dependent enzyme [Clostridia bacterium]|nr:aminotransferase class I/II-fold pyridoxal phosphate-dependent enzyme [Clostridia bacterium]
MKAILGAEKMENIHSDIRGPLFYEALDMQKRGIDVLKLNTGNPASFGFEMPESIKSALKERLDKALGYCDFRGMPEARAAITAYHKSKGLKDICEDDIYIGNGVSEVVTFALQSLLNPGDEVLLPSPCYSLWSNSVHLCDAKPVFYICDESSDWFPDCKDIEAKITKKTKAIVIINPNNPTGALYSKDLLFKIADVARRNNLLIFSDEIYDRLVLDGLFHTSVAALAPDIPVVTMNGLSKSHCLCGFRCGWMVISGPKTLTEKYRQNLVKLTSMRLCANALSQLVIPAALSDIKTPISMVSPGGRVFEQREAAAAELSKITSISFVKNKAAFYVFPRLDCKKLNISDDKKFARDLLHATNILIVPGSGFDWQRPDHFRIVMLPESKILKSAIHSMGEFLDTYKQK